MGNSRSLVHNATKRIIVSLLKGLFIDSDAKTKRTLKRLYENGLIEIDLNSREISLTKTGKRKALEFSIEGIKIKKPAIWDKKWRLIMFDIPNKKRYARLIFRNKLNELGFILYQESVYIYPYECTEEIEFIANTYRIRQYVRIVTAEKIDKEIFYLKKFYLIN